MAIGGKKKLDQIDADAFARQAKEMGLPESLAMRQVADMAVRALDAVEDAAAKLDAEGACGAEKIAEKLDPGIQERVSRLM